MISLNEILNYVDTRLDENPSEGTWINDLGEKTSVDVGYAYEWWIIMRDELIRKFGG